MDSLIPNHSHNENLEEASTKVTSAFPKTPDSDILSRLIETAGHKKNDKGKKTRRSGKNGNGAKTSFSEQQAEIEKSAGPDRVGQRKLCSQYRFHKATVKNSLPTKGKTKMYKISESYLRRVAKLNLTVEPPISKIMLKEFNNISKMMSPYRPNPKRSSGQIPVEDEPTPGPSRSPMDF